VGLPARFGSRRGESLRVVIDAYREAGTYNGAARLLDERKVPTRKGRPWSGMTVRSLRGPDRRLEIANAQQMPGEAHTLRASPFVRCASGTTGPDPSAGIRRAGSCRGALIRHLAAGLAMVSTRDTPSLTVAQRHLASRRSCGSGPVYGRTRRGLSAAIHSQPRSQ
jgi:hypothetical protein